MYSYSQLIKELKNFDDRIFRYLENYGPDPITPKEMNLLIK